MKSVGLVQIFCPVKETNRTHSQSYVEDLSTQTGRKRCTKTVVLNLSVLPSFLFTDFIILRSYIVDSRRVHGSSFDLLRIHSHKHGLFSKTTVCPAASVTWYPSARSAASVPQPSAASRNSVGSRSTDTRCSCIAASFPTHPSTDAHASPRPRR